MLPALDEVLATMRVVTIPLRSRFRSIEAREAVLLAGPFGWSEFSPFLEYDDEEAAWWLAAALESGWQPAPTLRRGEIRVNATVPAVAAGDVAGVLARFPGCRTAKVKVAEPGQTLADDVARVAAARAALGPEGRVRVDANGAWNLDEAEHAIRALEPFDLEYVEQPCAHLEELAELRRRVHRLGIPIAADESVRKADDPLAVARAGAADILVVKLQPLGGIARAQWIIREAGLPVVVSSALETSVGIAMSARFAASVDVLDFDCGLGTVALLAGDVTTEPLLPVDGAVPVRPVTPDPALLDRFAAPAERVDWWRDRLRRCHAVLTIRPETLVD